MWEGSALATYHIRVDKGWLPQHESNTKYHLEKTANDTDKSLHDKVTIAPHTGDLGEVITEEVAVATDNISDADPNGSAQGHRGPPPGRGRRFPGQHAIVHAHLKETWEQLAPLEGGEVPANKLCTDTNTPTSCFSASDGGSQHHRNGAQSMAQCKVSV